MPFLFTGRRQARLTVFAALVVAISMRAEETRLISAPVDVRYESIAKGAWRPIGVDGKPFWFTLGGGEESEVHQKTIAAKNLSDPGLPMYGVAEWCYSFHHLKNGAVDGAGYKHFGGFPTPPKTRDEAYQVVHSYFDRLVRDAEAKATPLQKRIRFSINGHYCYQHFGCEWGCDIVGSEVGENINSTQAHIAFTRGAARQFGKPWLMDMSSWYGPSMFDEDPKKHWGEYSGAAHGHSLSLHERTYLVSYMAGADVVVAEGGWLNFFTSQQPAEDGTLPLSRLGEVGAKFFRLTQKHPDRGIPYTPFALVIDEKHGIYPGFGPKRAWDVFPYTHGDQRILDIWEMFFPSSVVVQGRGDERGYLVHSPVGDTLDVLLRNASDDVLARYPVLLLAGEQSDDEAFASRLRQYVENGGVLLLSEEESERIHLELGFKRPGYSLSDEANGYVRLPCGKGAVIVYSERGRGDDRPLVQLLTRLRDELLPVIVKGKVEYLVNRTSKGWVITLVNNEGITKDFRSPPKIDADRREEVLIRYTGSGAVDSFVLWSDDKDQPLDIHPMKVQVPPGETRIVELTVRDSND